jgi:hypothetical protein
LDEIFLEVQFWSILRHFTLKLSRVRLFF